MSFSAFESSLGKESFSLQQVLQYDPEYSTQTLSDSHWKMRVYVSCPSTVVMVTGLPLNKVLLVLLLANLSGFLLSISSSLVPRSSFLS